METSNRAVDRAKTIEKLNSLPQALLEKVAEFIDYLSKVKTQPPTDSTEITQEICRPNSKISLPREKVNLKDWDAWQEWFDEREHLNSLLEHREDRREEGAVLTDASKQIRQDEYTQGLIEKYSAMGLDFSAE